MGPLDRIGRGAGAAAGRGRWLARGAWLLAAAEALVAVKDHLEGRLTAQERRRMVEIVRSSRGRPSNLSSAERAELQRLIGQVEPAQLARTVAQSSVLGRRRR